MNVQILAEQSQRYRVDGYFVLQSIISPEDLELLRSECQAAVDAIDEQMDRQGTDVLGINHRGKRYFCGQAYRTQPRLGPFIFGDLMAAICRATIGDNAYFHNDQYVVKSGETGMKFSWHQDSAYVQARIGEHPEHITCWCALDDVSEENGTVYILPVSRYGSRELANHIQDEQTNDRVGYFGDDPGEPLIVPAGSVAVMSSLTFHRSGPNSSGQQRRVYLTQYSPTPIVNRPGAHPQYFAQPFLNNGLPVVAKNPSISGIKRAVD